MSSSICGGKQNSDLINSKFNLFPSIETLFIELHVNRIKKQKQKKNANCFHKHIPLGGTRRTLFSLSDQLEIKRRRSHACVSLDARRDA